MAYYKCIFSKSTSIYGVEWDGSSRTSFVRTDAASGFSDPVPAVNNGNGSSPFDSLMPWAGMVRVDDSEAGVLVEIPKFWYKWTRNNSSMKLQISPEAQEGFFVSPAHADRGDGAGERDKVYVGAYHCGQYSQYKSVSNAYTQNNQTRATFRSNIHNLGTKIWQWDFAMYWTIAMLYLVEYADWNSQEKIGYGCSNSGYIDKSGACDAMTYHTGTNKAALTNYGHTRYRYIEDLWGNGMDFVDGVWGYYSNGSSYFYCEKNPSNFADAAVGTNLGRITSVDGYIKGWSEPTTSGFEYALIPNAISGTADSYADSYCCDRGQIDKYGMRVGGNKDQGKANGLFHIEFNVGSSNSGTNMTSRLMKLP